MSDSEYDHPFTSSKNGQGSNNKSGKRNKPSTSRKSPVSMRKKIKPSVDIFGLSKRSEESLESPTVVSYFVNRVANGTERRSASTSGEYYVDLKVYRTNDVRDTEALELWKKALVRIKFQAEQDSQQWRKLQSLVASVDELFDETPKFNALN